MSSTFIHIRMGKLAIVDQVVICDLSDIGTKTLEPLPLPAGRYNVFLQYTGNRLGIRTVGLSLSSEHRPPIMKHGLFQKSINLSSASGYIAIVDYAAALLMDKGIQRESVAAVRRSYVRASLMCVEQQSDVINEDVARMVVCETGIGPGKYPLYLREAYGRRENYVYRLSFMRYLDSTGKAIPIPSNESAKRGRF